MNSRKLDNSTRVSESFKLRADSAAFYEAWVGSVLARAGLYTLHHPFTVAEQKHEIGLYGQTWDLDVSASDMQGSWAETVEVEVKSLNVVFKNATSYPFEPLLVCSRKSFVAKWPGASNTQRDFLFVSRDTGAIVWLPVGSPVQLNTGVTDKTRGSTYMAVSTTRRCLRALDEFVEYVYDR